MDIDEIVVARRIRTMDPERPVVDAMAVADGLIVAVGTADELARAGGASKTRDYGDAVIVPGLHDVHAHPGLAGKAALFECRLDPDGSLDDLLSEVSAHAAHLDPDAWIVGGSWGPKLLGELANQAALRHLDAVTAGHPTVLHDVTLHNRWANSAALAAAGIGSSTLDPSGGQIVRENGKLTGLLLEAASMVVERVRSRFSPLDHRDEMKANEYGLGVLNAYGITAIQDAGASRPVLEALRSLDQQGRLSAWVVSSALANDTVFGADPVGPDLFDHVAEYRTMHHRPDFVKIFLDGVPSARTAAMTTAYKPDPQGHADFGGLALTAAELSALLQHAAAAGLGAKIHCTGDAAVAAALNAVEDLRLQGVSIRTQIAHWPFVRPDDIVRMAALEVVADASPPLWFPGLIPDAIRQVVDGERATRLQPVRNMLDAGVLLAAGSDWPVSPSPNPWEAMQGLVTREDPGGRHPGVLWPGQAVTPRQALAAFTVSSSAAMGLEGTTGRLSPGHSADFAILDRDPLHIDPRAIGATEVQETRFCGQPVFVR